MRKSDTPRAATYRLLIEYEGTRYSGWQEQRNARTVAGELLAALHDAGFPVAELGGSGRTDAGVHALEQCAHLRLGQRVDPTELRRALNRRLPRDIHVLVAAPAPTSFHARHDAIARSYLYQLSRRRTALAKPWVWWVREPLDAERMRAAAGLLVGRHDFRHFADVDPGSSEPSRLARSASSEAAEGSSRRRGPSESTLVEVERVDVVEDGALIVLRIVASHFLWKMVRRLVGTLVRIGVGEVAPDILARLLEAAPPADDDPRPAQWTAPPSGLFLERVLYAGDPPLRPVAAVTAVANAPVLSSDGEDRGREQRGSRQAPPKPDRGGRRRDGEGPGRGGRPPRREEPRRGSRPARDERPPRDERPQRDGRPGPRGRRRPTR